MSANIDNIFGRPAPSDNQRPKARGWSPQYPIVFEYKQLWRHEQPLLDVLTNIYGDRRLDTLGGSYGWPVRYRQVEDYDGLNIETLGDYIAAFKDGETRLPYLRHLSLNRALAKLRQFIHDPEQFKPNWVRHPRLDRLGGPEIFLGQAGTIFGHLHQDQTAVHVGWVQLQGEKEVVMFPPEDGRYLYRMEGIQFPFEWRNSAVNFTNLENYERFPLLKQASPRRIILREGEAMLLPADWWHTTRNVTDSISYNIRIVNSSNAATTLWRHVMGFPRSVQRLLR